MKIVYDSDKDILQLSFCQAIVEETTQIAPGLVADYDEDGKIIGIEVRKASARVDNPYEITYLVGKSNDSKPSAKVSE